MNPSRGERAVPEKGKNSFFKAFLAKLRKRKIIETLAAFIGGGWLILEFVDRLLVAHYHFPDETIDLTFITILAALICTVLWRWFRGTEKRPGNVKIEVLLVPLIILTALCIDLNILFDIAGILGGRLLTGIIALCLGIAWIIFKSLQWAAVGQTTPAVQADLQSERSDRDLGHIAATTAAEPMRIRSLAVLPLANLSRDPEQEYFADGMTEELITSLARFAELRVISRTSSMHFKGTKKTLPEIARQLHVDGVVEGTVRRAGDRVRITAQLIHAATDQHIWAETYERDLGDILVLQSEVARAIVAEIQIKLTPQERVRIASIRRVVPEAYEDYLKGRQGAQKWSREEQEKSIAHLEQSIQKDSDYAPSYAGLDECYCWLALWGMSPPRPFFSKAKAAVAKALKLDGALAQAHAVLGSIQWQFDWDFAAAEKEFKQAIELNPGNANVRFQYGLFLNATGRSNECVSELIIGQRLDPVSPEVSQQLAMGYFFARRYDQAISQFKEAIDLGQSAFAHSLLAATYARKGMYSEAISTGRKASELLSPGTDIMVDVFLADAYVISNSQKDALNLLELWERIAGERYVDATHMSSINLALDRRDRAFEWLNRAFEERSPLLPCIKSVPIHLDKLGSDPRYHALLRRVGFSL
jgi:TolB-like protein/cytochrome c-type biogenesis protein CcmH/NrfG